MYRYLHPSKATWESREWEKDRYKFLWSSRGYLAGLWVETLYFPFLSWRYRRNLPHHTGPPLRGVRTVFTLVLVSLFAKLSFPFLSDRKASATFAQHCLTQQPQLRFTCIIFITFAYNIDFSPPPPPPPPPPLLSTSSLYFANTLQLLYMVTRTLLREKEDKEIFWEQNPRANMSELFRIN